MIDYPPYTTVLNVSVPPGGGINDSLQVRDLLEIEIQPLGTKKGMFICMNPSKANRQESDKTVNSLLNFALSETIKTDSSVPNLKTVVITNIFPYYNTSSNSLYNVLENFMVNNQQNFKKWQERNLSVIQEAIDEVDYVILAWGDPPSANIHNQDSGNLALYHRSYVSDILAYINSKQEKDIFILETDSGSILTKSLNPRHPAKRQQTILGLKPCRAKIYYGIE
jgi:hypothetical protein